MDGLVSSFNCRSRTGLEEHTFYLPFTLESANLTLLATQQAKSIFLVFTGWFNAPSDMGTHNAVFIC